MAYAHSGDDDDFNILLAACRPLIAQAVHRLGFSSAVIDLDDLSQVARLAIRYAAVKFDCSRASFRTFAARCIHNKLANALRDARCFGDERLDCVADEDGTRLIDLIADAGAADPTSQPTRADELKAVLRRLNPRERQIARALAAGQSYAAIGHKLGIGREAVHSAIRRMRARVNLRQVQLGK